MMLDTISAVSARDTNAALGDEHASILSSSSSSNEDPASVSPGSSSQGGIKSSVLFPVTTLAEEARQPAAASHQVSGGRSPANTSGHLPPAATSTRAKSRSSSKGSDAALAEAGSKSALRRVVPTSTAATASRMSGILQMTPTGLVYEIKPTSEPGPEDNEPRRGRSKSAMPVRQALSARPVVREEDSSADEHEETHGSGLSAVAAAKGKARARSPSITPTPSTCGLLAAASSTTATGYPQDGAESAPGGEGPRTRSVRFQEGAAR